MLVVFCRSILCQGLQFEKLYIQTQRNLAWLDCMPSLMLTSLFLTDRSNQRARLHVAGRSTFMSWSDLVTRGCLGVANDPFSFHLKEILLTPIENFHWDLKGAQVAVIWHSFFLTSPQVPGALLAFLLLKHCGLNTRTGGY